MIRVKGMPAVFIDSNSIRSLRLPKVISPASSTPSTRAIGATVIAE